MVKSVGRSIGRRSCPRWRPVSHHQMQIRCSSVTRFSASNTEPWGVGPDIGEGEHSFHEPGVVTLVASDSGLAPTDW